MKVSNEAILAELAALRVEIAIMRRIVERSNNNLGRLVREGLLEQPRVQQTLSFRHLERLKAGRVKAKANGVRMGRRPVLSDEQKRAALVRRDNGETAREVARSLGVSASTISRLG